MSESDLPFEVDAGRRQGAVPGAAEGKGAQNPVLHCLSSSRLECVHLHNARYLSRACLTALACLTCLHAESAQATAGALKQKHAVSWSQIRHDDILFF